MNHNEKWLEWAVSLQSIAQAGLFYGKDKFDLERYEQIRHIAAEMMSAQTDIPFEKVKDLFCNETGYQTPKLDVRAAIFNGGQILLVKETNGTWSLPGGWVDADTSVKESAIKEVKEEAGLHVTVDRVIAVQDRDKHNLPRYAYKICKVFVLCSATSGAFRPNMETTESRYFSLSKLPSPLADEKTTAEQIRMCFDAHRAEHWETLID